jgi:hypothetical protein
VFWASSAICCDGDQPNSEPDYQRTHGVIPFCYWLCASVYIVALRVRIDRPAVQFSGAEVGYASAKNHRSAGFRCEPKAPPAEWASAAERSPRYKPRPTTLVQ